MKGIYVVYRKELYRFFASPIFYVVAFIFLALVGYFFYSSVAYYSLLSFQAGRTPFLSEQLNLTDMVLEPFFGSICVVLLLMVPLITMRLFAEEKKTGTVELLFTYPISDRGRCWESSPLASLFWLFFWRPPCLPCSYWRLSPIPPGPPSWLAIWAFC